MWFPQNWNPIALTKPGLRTLFKLMKQCCLEIKNLDKLLGNRAAISQLNLSISKGKKIALLGLNGAGKSSFIRLLVGESKPDDGQINYKIDQPEIKHKNRISGLEVGPQDLLFKQSLGYQSDTMLAIGEMTGREYLNLCGSFKKLKHKIINKQIDLISLKWSIANLLEQPMSTLSKGNLQKLAIAQAFIGEPKWLFFDEPCQSLDPLEQDRFNQNIKDLNDIQLCIFSTHNVSHALEVADEVILFHQAKIVYHFKIQSEANQVSEKHPQYSYLMVCKNPSINICEFSAELDLSIQRIGQQVYQIQTTKTQSIEQLKKNLQQESVVIEFCLDEAQAVMPLFRLLASGEINFDQHNLVSSLQLEGAGQ